MPSERLVPWEPLHVGRQARGQLHGPGSDGKGAVQVAQRLLGVCRIEQKHRVHRGAPASDYPVVYPSATVAAARSREDRRRVQPQFVGHDR